MNYKFDAQIKVKDANCLSEKLLLNLPEKRSFMTQLK